MKCECGNHFWKPINRGAVILVSPIDAAILASAWYVAADARGYLSVRRNDRYPNGARRQVRLARQIMVPPPNLVVDHIDMNTLDNRRENLRVCPDSKNRINRRARKGKAVPLKGVRRCKSKFQAMITNQGRQYYLGTFETAEAAHSAYAFAAKRLHGDFARLK